MQSKSNKRDRHRFESDDDEDKMWTFSIYTLDGKDELMEFIEQKQKEYEERHNPRSAKRTKYNKSYE